ncbi:MAG: phage tail tape measure C-terminal domain-containing protein [Candidatus Phlomobacter fragariae]
MSEQAANAYANVANITQFAFDGMSHWLSDFLLIGKANFADFTKSVLEMMVKMMTQMAMLQAMKAAFGGQTGGFGGALAGILGFSSLAVVVNMTLKGLSMVENLCSPKKPPSG